VVTVSHGTAERPGPCQGESPDEHRIEDYNTMIYAIYRYESEDDDDLYGPVRYVQADSIEEIEEVFPRSYFLIKELEIETLAWIKIQEQMLYA